MIQNRARHFLFLLLIVVSCGRNDHGVIINQQDFSVDFIFDVLPSEYSLRVDTFSDNTNQLEIVYELTSGKKRITMAYDTIQVYDCDSPFKDSTLLKDIFSKENLCDPKVQIKKYANVESMVMSCDDFSRETLCLEGKKIELKYFNISEQEVRQILTIK